MRWQDGITPLIADYINAAPRTVRQDHPLIKPVPKRRRPGQTLRRFANDERLPVEVGRVDVFHGLFLPALHRHECRFDGHRLQLRETEVERNDTLAVVTAACRDLARAENLP